VIETLAQCVDRGVLYLDNKRPGWPGRVDLSTLDMGNGCFDLLSQVEGVNYRQALVRLGLSDGETRGRDGRQAYPDLAGIPYGYMAHASEPPQEGIERFGVAELNAAWAERIGQLRDERKVV